MKHDEFRDFEVWQILPDNAVIAKLSDPEGGAARVEESKKLSFQ
jgi:hypothetical protein